MTRRIVALAMSLLVFSMIFSFTSCKKKMNIENYEYAIEECMETAEDGPTFIRVTEYRYPIPYEDALKGAIEALGSYQTKGINKHQGVCLLTSTSVSDNVFVSPRESGITGIEDGAEYVIDIDLYSFQMSSDGEVVHFTCHNPVPMTD